MPALYEWYAIEVGGTVTDLQANLSTIDSQGWEIFSVIISPRGWTIVARKPKVEEKTLDEKPAERPEPSRRGTVLLHKGHKK